MADRTIELVQKVFPNQVCVNDKGITLVKILDLQGAQYIWKPYESALRERFIFGLTAAGIHLSNQNYKNIFSEYSLHEEVKKSKDHEKVDFVIKNLDNNLILGLIENGIYESINSTETITADGLDTAIYTKLSQVVSAVIASKPAMKLVNHKLDKKHNINDNSLTAFNVNIYHIPTFLENTKQFHQFVNLDKSLSYFERFKRTGIASVTFYLSYKQLSDFRARFPHGFTADSIRDENIFNLNTPFSNIAVLYLNGGSVTGNRTIEPTQQSFRYIFDQAKVEPLVLNRILPRSFNAGGSWADNPREKKYDTIYADRAPFVKSIIEYLRKNHFKYDPISGDTVSMEAPSITSGDRYIKGSKACNIVDFKDVLVDTPDGQQIVEKETLVISSDMALNDAQHSNDTLILIKKAMIEANGDVVKIKDYLTDGGAARLGDETLKNNGLGLKGINKFSASNILKISEMILRLTPSIAYDTYTHPEIMAMSGAIKQNFKEQELEDKVRFANKVFLKTIATALSPHEFLLNYEILGGPGFSDASNHTLDTGLSQKHIADVSNTSVAYLHMKDFDALKEKTTFTNDLATYNLRVSNGTLTLKHNNDKIITMIQLMRKGIATAQGWTDIKRFCDTYIKSVIPAKIKTRALAAISAMQEEYIKDQDKIWKSFFNPLNEKKTQKDYGGLFTAITNTVNYNMDINQDVDSIWLNSQAQKISDLKESVDVGTLAPLTLMVIAINAKLKELKILVNETLPKAAAAAIIGYKEYVNGANILEKSAQEIIDVVESTIDMLHAKSQKAVWKRIQMDTVDQSHLEMMIEYFKDIIDFEPNLAELIA